jgi:TfoX/Sxy family transcriptional regulator of competence genes
LEAAAQDDEYWVKPETLVMLSRALFAPASKHAMNHGDPMPHVPKALQAILEKVAPPDLELTFKPMFGGIMGYAAGKVFVSLSDVGLGLKLAGADREALLAIPDAKPLQYEPHSPPSKSYVVVPDAMLSDGEALRAWTVRSVAGLPPKSAKV